MKNISSEILSQSSAYSTSTIKLTFFLSKQVFGSLSRFLKIFTRFSLNSWNQLFWLRITSFGSGDFPFQDFAKYFARTTFEVSYLDFRFGSTNQITAEYQSNFWKQWSPTKYLTYIIWNLNAALMSKIQVIITIAVC